MYASNGLLLFTRTLGNVVSLVALNFSNSTMVVPFTFSVSGPYVEEISGQPLLDAQTGAVLNAVTANVPVNLTIPSNYGCVWTVTSP